MRAADPKCRFVWAEPLIHVAPRDHEEAEIRAAEGFRSGQFEVYDMLLGRSGPHFGGCQDTVDVIGLNFYPHNQWYFDGPTIPMGHHEYRPLADMLVEVFERYRRPLLISETGSEGSARPAWFHYVCDEVREAMRRGLPILGICLYPITAYPGWDNSRHAEVGLFSTIGSDGTRALYPPLVAELKRQRQLFQGRSAEERRPPLGGGAAGEEYDPPRPSDRSGDDPRDVLRAPSGFSGKPSVIGGGRY